MTEKLKDDEFLLGERKFKATPLCFDDIQELTEQFSALNQPLSGGGFIAARRIVEIALKDTIKPEELKELKVTVDQVMAAAGTIGLVTGFVALGEAMARTKTGAVAH